MHYVLFIKSTAHPNVLGEAKFFAENSGLVTTRTVFIDEHGNFIAIEPMSKEVDADLTHGQLSEDRFAGFPTNYEVYSIQLETTTLADLDFIEKWHSSQKIFLYNRCYPNDDVMARVSEIQEKKHLTFAVAKSM